MKYGIIAGNGRFPVIALETARKQGDEAIAIAIKEEASKEVERAAARCYWISLGELSRLIEICRSEGITQIMMAGQVKHAKIFSSIRPDWRLVKLLAGLLHKNTDSLIGAVAKVLAGEGIQLVDSTLLLKPLLAPAGAVTREKWIPRNSAISNMDAASRMHWRASTWARAWRSPIAPAWRSKRWKARTRCCGARPAWWKGSD